MLNKNLLIHELQGKEGTQAALGLPELQVGSTCRLEYWHLFSEQ